MKKNIANIIAAINLLLACGTCGALENGTVSVIGFVVRCVIFFGIALFALRIARAEERFEQEVARRSAARTARQAAFEMDARPVSHRVVRSVSLVRR